MLSHVYIQIGLHTCFHAFADPHHVNHTLIHKHEEDLPVLMMAIRQAIDRNYEAQMNAYISSSLSLSSSSNKSIELMNERKKKIKNDHHIIMPIKTTVIMLTAGRIGDPNPESDRCIWRFNRLATR